MAHIQWPKYGLISLILIFFAVPGRYGIFDGVPFEDPHELIILVILIMACAFLPLGRLDAKKRRVFYVASCILITASILKITIGFSSLPHGLIARYGIIAHRATAEKQGTQSKMTVERSSAENRVSETISFGSKGYSSDKKPFSLWFLNDRNRFNAENLDKTLIPFRAEWNGYAEIKGPKPDISLVSDGNADMTIDAIPWEEFVAWKAGMYPIRITYEPGKGNSRFIGLMTRSGKVPFRELFPKMHTEREIARDGIFGWLAAVILMLAACAATLLFHALLAGARWREWLSTWRPWALAVSIACFAALITRIFAAAHSPYFNMLYSGSDELTYETYARHIRFTGNWGMGVLEQEAYYYQLYYYFLTLMHYLGGEGLMSVFIMQAAFLVAAACMLAKSAFVRTDNSGSTGKWILFAVAFSGIALIPELAKETAHLMPTIMGILFATLTATLVINVFRPDTEKPYSMSAIAGIAFGLGIMNRYNMIAWLPFLLIYMSLHFKKRGCVPPLAFIAGLALALAPCIARNRIVAHQWRLVSQSNTTINFVLGTPIPKEFKPMSAFRAETTPLLRTIFDGRANGTIEWIREEPRAYLDLLRKKAGLAVAMHPLLWAAFCVMSLIWLIRPKAISESLERKGYLVYGGFVISQFLIITVFSTGNDRYYFVITPFLIVFAVWLCMPVQRSMNSLFQSSKQMRSHMRWP